MQTYPRYIRDILRGDPRPTITVTWRPTPLVSPPQVLPPSKRDGDAYRRQKYGLAPEQYDALVLASQGRCALCDRPADLNVDHCHATGVVRGLLCQPCNLHLAFVENHGHRDAWFQRAADYLGAPR